MDKPASAGSQATSKDGAGGTASPYGTRSRNRNGGARPNYAEDKDIDMDLFDNYSERRDDDSRKTITRQASFSNNAAQTTPRSGNGTSRKPLPDDTKHQSISQPSAATTNSSTPKDHHGQSQAMPSAASGTAVNGSTNKSKKRKADAAAASGSQTPSAPSGANQTSVHRRQAGNGGGNANGNNGSLGAREGGYAETNLLTFENCGARLKNGKMVADDGTVLEVNGKVPPGAGMRVR